jgi:hypothetical protein
MMPSARQAYIQARLQARHGMRPVEETWLELAAQKDLHAYLQTARRTGLRPWVLSLRADDNHHFLERQIRLQYRDYVRQVAEWQPRKWQAAVLWINHLADLPALAYLLDDNTPPAWMSEDPYLKPFTAVNRDLRISAMQQSVVAPVVEAWLGGTALIDGWLNHWQSLWPGVSKVESKGLQDLTLKLRRHVSESMESTMPDSNASRSRLAHSLTMLFRRHAMQPAATFSHLALIALDNEQLRGAIVQRAVFGKAGAGRQ